MYLLLANVSLCAIGWPQSPEAASGSTAAVLVSSTTLGLDIYVFYKVYGWFSQGWHTLPLCSAHRAIPMSTPCSPPSLHVYTPSFKHVSTCPLICIFVDFGTSVASSSTFLIWKKNICAAVFESELSVHHSWGDGKPNTSFPSHSVCVAVRSILPCTQKPLNTQKSGPSVHPAQCHSLCSSVLVEKKWPTQIHH